MSEGYDCLILGFCRVVHLAIPVSSGFSYSLSTSCIGSVSESWKFVPAVLNSDEPKNSLATQGPVAFGLGCCFDAINRGGRDTRSSEKSVCFEASHERDVIEEVRRTWTIKNTVVLMIHENCIIVGSVFILYRKMLKAN